ncbi:hypothetical protein AB0M80_03110 [Amycolatopsis sp. NPDC051045]|uniref:hypothetical protein n=1 Tax=Amycolatopsis sp. NPDC051045 TaxID=3156922 RepID=UPI00342F5C3D
MVTALLALLRPERTPVRRLRDLLNDGLPVTSPQRTRWLVQAAGELDIMAAAAGAATVAQMRTLFRVAGALFDGGLTDAARAAELVLNAPELSLAARLRRVRDVLLDVVAGVR